VQQQRVNSASSNLLRHNTPTVSQSKSQPAQCVVIMSLPGADRLNRPFFDELAPLIMKPIDEKTLRPAKMLIHGAAITTGKSNFYVHVVLRIQKQKKEAKVESESALP
jgi:hypothetical protein